MKHLILLAFLAWFAPLAFSQTSGQIVLQKKNAGAGYTLETVTPAANGLLAFDGSADPTVVTSLAQSVITNLTTDLGNKQPLDSDLTAIAAVTTTSYGRSVLALADAAAARTLFGTVIGTDVLAFDTQVQQIAALTDPNADRLLFWDDSDNAYKHLELGTNLSITGTTLNASGGGGGGEHPGTSVAYIFPQVGNDTTGDGTLAAPYDTIQAAFDDGFRVFYLGEGSAGSLVATGTNTVVSIRGAGRNHSTISAFQYSGTGFCVVNDTGGYSFAIGSSSSPHSPPADGSQTNGTAGPNITFVGVYFTGSITSNGTRGSHADVCGSAGDGGTGGILVFQDCWLDGGFTISSTGGAGGDGTDSRPSGNGANGASITFENCLISSSYSTIESVAGGAGVDNGGGSGTSGAADGIYLRRTNLRSATSPTGSVVDIKGCIINESFISSSP